MTKYMLVMVVSVTIASISQIFLKKSTFYKHDNVIKEYLNVWVISGYVLLGASMLLTIFAYSGMDFKNGPIIEALGNVIVPVLSYLFFKEKLTLKKVLGIACIILGVICFYL